MTYAFLHAGVLIGVSPLDLTSPHPGQRGGLFIPTPRGRAVVARLIGVLSDLHAFRQECAGSGVAPDALGDAALAERMEASVVGRRIIAAERTMHQLELRSASGTPLAFESIAFSDAEENRRLARALDPMMPALPPPAPEDATTIVVSVVFGAPLPSVRWSWSPDGAPHMVRQ